MRIVYLGTPDFAVAPLKAIMEVKNVEVVAVVTNHDKPVGRKQVLTPPPVKVLAKEKGIEVLQYKKIRLEGVEKLKELKPDLMITCAFGQILSQEIIDIPKLGVVNIHASLLPKYRGASPIHYAILNGEKETGITIMKTDVGIDTGDIIYQEKTEIQKNEKCGELFDRLSELGAKCIKRVLPDILTGKYKLIKQDDKLATYSKMVKKEDALIDFNDTAENVVNKIRAYNPSPIAYTFYNGEQYKIYDAEVDERKGNVGDVISNSKELIIACKDKSISVKMIQKQGGKSMDIKSYLLGNKPQIQSKFGV